MDEPLFLRGIASVTKMSLGRLYQSKKYKKSTPLDVT